MNDDRISRALSANADAIELRPGDPAAVMRRGSARRNRRRAAVGGLAAVAVAATSFSVATREPSNDIESDAASATLVESPFDWTVVTPESGLGFSGSTVVVGGAVYSLSTAPGEDLPEDERYDPALYRSEDGSEWTEVTLPDGVTPSSLAASGDTLYAIGTAPAGGDARSVVVSSSTDGAATWADAISLPSDVADIEARYPGQVMLSQPVVAALDSTHLVASVSVSVQPDVEALLPGIADPEMGWGTSPEGITLYEAVPCDDDGTCDPVGATTTTTAAPEAEASAVDAAADRTLMESRPGRTYTWEELGVDPELVDLITGRTYVYASQDGATFERAALPVEPAGWGSLLTASADGYTLVAAGADTSTVLTSPDGVSWTVTATLPGSAYTVGLLGGRPAVASYVPDGTTSIQVAQASDTWVPLDLGGAVDGGSLGDVVFGPLGVTALVWAEDGQSPTLLHSVDGHEISVVPLADHVDALGVIDLDVSADVITVRFGRPVDENGELVGPQQVLVGTPR